MEWIQVCIFTSGMGIEPVTGRLYQLGIAGVEIEDEAEFNDFLENNKQYWDYVDEELRKKMAGETRVKIYLSNNASGNETLLAVRESIEQLKALDTDNSFGRLEIALVGMDEEDWANNWKKYFKPLKVGEKILIKPEWEPLSENEENRIVFSINPGMLFGTGSHESTRLCIEAAEHYVKNNLQILDLGCGSGILSIIALLLGAKNALAVDIDPNCVQVAYENAQRNCIGHDRYTVISGNVITDESVKKEIGFEKYDVVFANIVADVIIALSSIMLKQLKAGGVLICSGIIDERRDEVKAVLEAEGFKVIEVKEERGWVALVLKKSV